MNNQRINILRDELDQRCKEILDYKLPYSDNSINYYSTSESFFQTVAEYVLFILSSPEYKFEFQKLVFGHDTRLKSKEVRLALDNAKKNIKELANKLLQLGNSNSVSSESNTPNWKSLFGLSTKLLTKYEFLTELRDTSDYGDNPVETITLVLDRFNFILTRLVNVSNRLQKKFWKLYKDIDNSLGQLQTQLEFKPKYGGCTDAKYLCGVFAYKYPDRKIKRECFNNVSARLENMRREAVVLSDDFTKYVQKCKVSSLRISKILSRTLTARRLKNYTMERLKIYMEAIYRIKHNKSFPHENKLTGEMAKFLFIQGFTPFIRFKTIDETKEPDILAISSHEELLIEVKKYPSDKKKKPTLNNLAKNIDQAYDYYTSYRDRNSDIDNEVFLVILYNGNYMLVIQPDRIEYKKKSDVFVNIIPMYLGDKTASQSRPKHLLTLNYN